MQVAQRNRGAMQFPFTGFAMQPDIQLFDVLDLGELIQPQCETAKPASSASFKCHGRCRHETGKFAYTLAPLDQPVFSDGTLAAPGASVSGYGQVMPAKLFLGHAGAVIMNNDWLTTQRLRQGDEYPLCIGIPCVIHELLQRPFR